MCLTGIHRSISAGILHTVTQPVRIAVGHKRIGSQSDLRGIVQTIQVRIVRGIGHQRIRARNRLLTVAETISVIVPIRIGHQRIQAHAELQTIQKTVAVGVRAQGVGPGVASTHEGTGIGLDDILQAVTISIGFEGIRADPRLDRIEQAVIIVVRVTGVALAVPVRIGLVEVVEGGAVVAVVGHTVGISVGADVDESALDHTRPTKSASGTDREVDCMPGREGRARGIKKSDEKADGRCPSGEVVAAEIEVGAERGGGAESNRSRCLDTGCPRIVESACSDGAESDRQGRGANFQPIDRGRSRGKRQQHHDYVVGFERCVSRRESHRIAERRRDAGGQEGTDYTRIAGLATRNRNRGRNRERRCLAIRRAKKTGEIHQTQGQQEGGEPPASGHAL